MNVYRALAILGRRWPIVVLATIGALMIGAAAIAAQGDAYRATATLWLSGNRLGGQYLPVGDIDALAQTYARLANLRPTVEQAVRMSGQPVSSDDLAKMISARVVPRALIEVSVTTPDRDQAVPLTNAVANAMTTSDRAINSARYERSRQALESQVAAVQREISRLDRDAEPLRIQEREGRISPTDKEALSRTEDLLARQHASQAALLGSLEDLRVAEAGATTPISVVEPAVEAFSTRSTTKSIATLLVAAMLGLAAGLAAAFGLDYLDDRLSDEQTAAARSHLAVLGTVPTAKDAVDPKTHPAYRRLASHVLAALPPGANRLIVIGEDPNLAAHVASRLQLALDAVRPARTIRVEGSGNAAAIPFIVEPGTPVLIASTWRMTTRRAETLADEVESLAGTVLGLALASRRAKQMKAPVIRSNDPPELTAKTHLNGLSHEPVAPNGTIEPPVGSPAGSTET